MDTAVLPDHSKPGKETEPPPAPSPVKTAFMFNNFLSGFGPFVPVRKALGFTHPTPHSRLTKTLTLSQLKLPEVGMSVLAGDRHHLRE